MMFSQILSGREAAEMGLADELVDKGQTQARALELARQLAGR